MAAWLTNISYMYLSRERYSVSHTIPHSLGVPGLLSDTRQLRPITGLLPSKIFPNKPMEWNVPASGLICEHNGT